MINASTQRSTRPQGLANYSVTMAALSMLTRARQHVAFLVSDSAGYLAGLIIWVDGGELVVTGSEGAR